MLGGREQPVLRILASKLCGFSIEGIQIRGFFTRLGISKLSTKKIKRGKSKIADGIPGTHLK